ncbi:MAG: hypothetical protein LC722_04630 [Actinobacteria bacterium]|nr:hypothetical protein [Actinomycetota bacterium]
MAGHARARIGMLTLMMTLVSLVETGSNSRALAHDHREPQVFLRADGIRQNPWVTQAQWVRRDAQGCEIIHGDGPYEFPPPVPVSLGSDTFTLVLAKSARPKRLEIRVSRLDPSVFPRTDRAVPYTLHPIRRLGKILRWEASWSQAVVLDAYFDVLVVWRDEDRCRSDQYFQLQFHVRSPV